MKPENLDFRVFDTGKNEYIDIKFGGICISNQIKNYYELELCFNMDIDNQQRENLNKSDLIFELFTGIKDSNGVKIYEGDIVKGAINGNKITGEVRFGRDWAAFVVLHDENEVCLCYGILADFRLRDLQVIDNIHKRRTNTGFRDCQGKEIFVGDILQIKTDLIVFHSDIVFEEQKYQARSLVDPNTKCELSIFLKKNPQSFVVGNIYENQEVIENYKEMFPHLWAKLAKKGKAMKPEIQREYISVKNIQESLKNLLSSVNQTMKSCDLMISHEVLEQAQECLNKALDCFDDLKERYECEAEGEEE